MQNTILDTVNSLLPGKRKTNSVSGWTSFNAVCCPHRGESQDSRGRGGIITNPTGSISYSCFNCNYTTNYTPGRHLNYKFRKLLTWLGADENTIKRLVIDAIRIKELIAPESIAEPETKEDVVFKPRPLPEGSVSFDQFVTFYDLNDWQDVADQLHQAVAYIYERKIDLKKYDFYITDDTAYNLHKRVIIPFTWRNEIIGYTARAMVDGVKPKYHNSHEPNYVFNIDQQLPTSKFVIVVEGPFDAMAVDGVSVLSNECNERQADIIDSLGREVIVVPDRDKPGMKLVDFAIEYGWSVSYPDWEDDVKDCNSAVVTYGKLFTLKSILAAKETNKLKIELKKKKYHA